VRDRWASATAFAQNGSLFTVLDDPARHMAWDVQIKAL
jgi:hypothetical protein